MEGVLELEGLWDIVSGKQSRPTAGRTTATQAATTRCSASTTASSDSDILEAWIARARRAWITIDLSIANEIRHITKTFSKEDPFVLWRHLEKKYQPDTAIEVARMYRQLLEIQPKANDTAEETIERIEKARAELLESVSEIKVDELLGALVLFKLAPDFKDLVNLVYSTQSTPSPKQIPKIDSSTRACSEA